MIREIHPPYQEGNSTVIFDAKIWASQKSASSTRKLGFFFLALSILGLFYFSLPITLSKLGYYFYKNQTEKQAWTFGDLLAQEEDFFIKIPKLELTAKIIPNVNPVSKSEYLPALKKGVAHAQGSYFPGENGLVYLFAHSTDYAFNIKNFNALFYDLNKLNPGDQISLNYKGKFFNYQVMEKKIVAADDLSDLKNLGQERLILQTCWPPGTTWKRLLVIAIPKT